MNFLLNPIIKYGLLSLLLITFNACSDVSNVNTNNLNPDEPTPQTPADGASGVSTAPTLAWSSVEGTDFYQLQLSNSDKFATTFEDSTTEKTSLTVDGLPVNATLHWRVRSSVNSEFGPWSDVFTFETTSGNTSSPPPSSSAGDIWVTAYLPAWDHNAGTPNSNWGKVHTDQIRWDALTHMIYFGFTIAADGTPGTSLAPADQKNFNADRLNIIVPAAHANNTKILFSVGGAGNGTEFRSAIQPKNRATFINTIKDIMLEFGFDGVDMDMEPIHRSDYDTFRSFIRELRTELDNITTTQGNRPLLTAAGTKGDGELFGSLNDSFDQVNIMSYDFVLAWQGWQTYHHTALFEGSARLESTGAPFPSVDGMAQNYLEGGLSIDKLGIGVDFNGYVWKGVHLLDTWPGWPEQDLSIIEGTGTGGIPYADLAQVFNFENAQWDEETQTSFLELDRNAILKIGPNPLLDIDDIQKAFIAFDNERSIKRKIQYTRDRGYGGVMIWSYGEDLMPDESQPLLQALKEAVNN